MSQSFDKDDLKETLTLPSKHIDDDGLSSVSSFEDVHPSRPGIDHQSTDAMLSSKYLSTNTAGKTGKDSNSADEVQAQNPPADIWYVRRVKDANKWTISCKSGPLAFHHVPVARLLIALLSTADSTSDQPFESNDDENDNNTETEETVGPPEKPVFKIVTSISKKKIKARRSHVQVCCTDAESDSDSDTSLDSDSGSTSSLISYSPHDDVVVDRAANSRRKPEKRTEKMVIYSQHLINALHAVSYDPEGVGLPIRSVTCEAPYTKFRGHARVLRFYQTVQPLCHSQDYAATTSKHIGIFLDYLVRNKYIAENDDEVRYDPQGRPLVPFICLRLLYRKGELVYCRGPDGWKPAVIEDSVETRVFSRATRKILCWNIGFRNGRMTRVYREYLIEAFNHAKAIHDLDVVPAAYFTSEDEKLTSLGVDDQKLILRGRLYWELIKRPIHKEYDGTLFTSVDGPENSCHYVSILQPTSPG